MNIPNRCIELLRKSAYQKLNIQVDPLVGDSFVITEHDLEKGSFSIQRDSVDSDLLEVGNMTAAELKLTLNNMKDDNGVGKFDDISFGGAVLHSSLEIVDYDSVIETESNEFIETESGVALNTEVGGQAVYTIPLGVFTVDNQPRKLEAITLTALDNTVRLDVEFFKNELVFPTNLRTLVRTALNYCGMYFEEKDLSVFPTTDDILSFPQSTNSITCRQIIMWACQLVGKCSYADENGYIRFAFYEKTDNDFSISGADRYASSSELGETDTVITAHQFISNDMYYPDVLDDDTYVIQTEDNSLFSALDEDKKIEYALKVDATLKGFAYREFSATTMSYPQLFPLQRITYKKGDLEFSTILTNVTFQLNGDSTLSAKAKSRTENGYAKLGAFTAKQKSIINPIKETASEAKTLSEVTASELSTQENAVLKFNETAAQAMGLYHEEVTDETGGITYYWFDEPTKEESQYICMRNANGSFSTNTGWNNGHPVWTEGTDKYGNALCSLLNVIGIQAEWIKADSITTDKLSIGQTERGTNLILDSSFESNSIIIPGTYNEELTQLITPGHNDFWNAIKMTDSPAYDVVIDYLLETPVEGGFDGNKAIMDVNLKGKIDGVISLCSIETRKVIPVDLITHTMSFYYRVRKPYNLKTARVQYTTKIQWLNVNNTEIRTDCDTFIAEWEETESWHRHYMTVTPPNGVSSCRIAIGFQSPDEAIHKTLDETDGGSEGYSDLAFASLDGLLLEQGNMLNSWTCSENEVTNNGVIIDSKGLNVADGKIYVSDTLGNKVLFTDGNQILQYLGGTTSRKYDALTGDVSATMKSLPIQYVNDRRINNHLGYEFTVIDEYGVEKILARMGITFPLDSSSGKVIQHSPYDLLQPLEFYNENGFIFNGSHSLISDAQYRNDLDMITTPGWYYGDAPVSQGRADNPVDTEFVLCVEQCGTYTSQTLNAKKRAFKRRYDINASPVWSDWEYYSADNQAKDINSNIETDFKGSCIGILAAGDYFQSDTSKISAAGTDNQSPYCYPAKQVGLLEVFKGAGHTIQRYTSIDGKMFTRYIGTEDPTYSLPWSCWGQI